MKICRGFKWKFLFYLFIYIIGFFKSTSNFKPTKISRKKWDPHENFGTSRP